MGRGILLTANLPQLQNLIKRDPLGYKEEFLQQWNHYNSIREIFKLHPDEQAQHFRELVSFISQVATCYPKETADFPAQISSLLLESYGTLSPDTRKSLVQNLVILRNKNVISSIELLRSLFPILPRTTSPTLRSFIRKTILSDIRTANLRTKNHKLNRAVQAMLFGMVERGMEDEVVGDKGKFKASNGSVVDGSAALNGEEAMWAVILTKELWRKGIWTDAKAVTIIALGCFHPVTKVQSASVHFFLGSDEDKADSDEDEEEEVNVRALHHRREINKKTRSADKKLQKALNAAKKASAILDESANFPALQLLNDPQTFAEKLFEILNRHDKRFSLDHKILIMQLLSRVMGAHKLCVLSFYTYIVKYLTHRQLRVPAILVALAQSVHDLTPPDAVTPVRSHRCGVQKLRDEEGVTLEEDEGAWDGWDVESESEDSDSDDEWINVSDDNADIVISDSEDEAEKAQSKPEAPPRISTLATTKILTPADFALLNDLRIQEATKAVGNGGGSHAKRKLASLEANKKSMQSGEKDDSFVSENDILGPRKKVKADYAERMASIQKGREGREKFKSNKGKVNKEVASSSTNREKARNKPIMMILSSGSVRGKKKASLREKQQKLRKHIDKAKKMRH
ncbi:hypothetical protein C0993_008065 [Termitomyces sp. T159_Od127]|nr:hypothetical protein C0993_008065 [Termitomyces sp. T159_Od127]